jgi:hypothetical protein
MRVTRQRSNCTCSSRTGSALHVAGAERNFNRMSQSPTRCGAERCRNGVDARSARRAPNRRHRRPPCQDGRAARCADFQLFHAERRVLFLEVNGQAAG